MSKSLEERTLICHECDGIMVRETRPTEIFFKGNISLVDLHGWYCTNCEESVHSSSDIKKTDKALYELKALMDSGILQNISKEV